jgi:hypothetical protein
MGIERGKRVGSSYEWSDEEIAFLTDYYPLAKRTFITTHLDRSWESIKSKSNELGIIRLKDIPDEHIKTEVECDKKEFVFKGYAGGDVFVCPKYPNLPKGKNAGVCVNCPEAKVLYTLKTQEEIEEEELRKLEAEETRMDMGN